MSIPNRNPQIAHGLGYRVLPDGTVTNPTGGVLKCFLTYDGYRKFSFRKNMAARVGRLVAYQKYGERISEPGVEVRHLDGNSRNDSDTNIAIGTHSENMQDSPAEVRRVKAGNANRKYNPAQVRAFYQQTRSYRATKQAFGMSSSGTLHFILNKAMGPAPTPVEQLQKLPSKRPMECI